MHPGSLPVSITQWLTQPSWEAFKLVTQREHLTSYNQQQNVLPYRNAYLKGDPLLLLPIAGNCECQTLAEIASFCRFVKQKDDFG